MKEADGSILASKRHLADPPGDFLVTMPYNGDVVLV